MKKWLFTILFGTTLVLGACGGDDGANESTDNGDAGTDTEEDGGTVDTAAGEEVFKANCTSCHGGDLKGGVGPDLTKVGADHSADDIKDIVQNGQGQMPAQKQVTGDDLDAVANWLAEKK